MSNLDSVLSQLRQQRDRLNAAIAALEGVVANSAGKTARRPSRSRISAAGRRRIAAAQRARWAKLKGPNLVAISATRRKGKMSSAARRRIAAAQPARWAALRRKQKAA